MEQAFNHLPPPIRSVIEGFLKRFDERIDELQACGRRGDLRALVRGLHKLKGAAGACGYSQLMEQIAQLEDQVRREGCIPSDFGEAMGQWPAYLDKNDLISSSY